VNHECDGQTDRQTGGYSIEPPSAITWSVKCTVYAT